MLTELEGAILTEVGFRGRRTAFQVRQAFRESPSLEWRGSAGSVYPAIKRLIAQGAIAAEDAQDARGTQILHVTETGQSALTAWFSDVSLSISIGADPFRLRAGLWDMLGPREKEAHATQLIAALEVNIVALRQYLAGQDVFEVTQVELAIALQQSRIVWLQDKIAQWNAKEA